MILIDKILVDEEISTSHFSCDLTKCKGACCTFPGEYGAPVLREEIEQMKKSLPSAMEYLSEKSKAVISRDGFVEGSDDIYHTVCINKKDCVFVYYSGDIALCSLEKAFIEGKTDFRKPVSCHLFPIRVSDFGGTHLYYQKISECNPAINNGKKNDLKIYQSVKDALIRSFGEEWYNKYVELIKKSGNQ
jgi:hypothetical protein